MWNIFIILAWGTTTLGMGNAIFKERYNPGIIFHQAGGIITYDHIINIVSKIKIPQKEDMIYDLDLSRIDKFKKNATYRDFMRLNYVRLIQTKYATNLLLPKTDHRSDFTARKINKYMNMKNYSDLEQKDDNIVMMSNEWNDELWMVIDNIKDTVEQFNNLKSNEHEKAIELMKTTRHLEVQKFEYMIDFSKYIEGLYNTYDAAKAITIQKYYQVSSKLRQRGYRFPVVRSDMELNKIASLQISVRGKYMITEISAPAIKHGYIELYGINTYKVSQDMPSNTSLEIKACGEYLLVEDKRTACINKDKLKKCKSHDSMKICQSDFTVLTEEESCESKFFFNQMTNPIKYCEIEITNNNGTAIIEYQQSNSYEKVAFFNAPENDVLEITCEDKLFQKVIRKVGMMNLSPNCEISSLNAKKVTTRAAPRLPRFDLQLTHLSAVAHRQKCIAYLASKKGSLREMLEDCVAECDREIRINLFIIYAGTTFVWVSAVVIIGCTIRAIRKVHGSYDAEEEAYRATIAYYTNELAPQCDLVRDCPEENGK
uniref:Uncharacterized protein n=1 Tax=Trichogramma kaykai TaxID=54128 RepID=A0ABD2XAY0_9HYME